MSWSCLRYVQRPHRRRARHGGAHGQSARPRMIEASAGARLDSRACIVDLRSPV
jgi:hypothetical protein